MWLPADVSLWLAGGSGLVWAMLRGRSARSAGEITRLSKEAGLLLVVYALWRRLGQVSVVGIGDALARGRQIWHIERRMWLPNEVTLQRWALHATWLVRFANAYYIVFHVAPLGIFLIWLYVRHRDQFGHWRNQLAFVSLVCAVIQFVPVAPPRMFPQYGFVDTAAKYGPSVYHANGLHDAGQLAAMPSMHVGWALLIGIAAMSVGRSRWRWLGPAHAALTVFAVTVTAYHWLLDGIVAAGILLAGMAFAAATSHRGPRADDATPPSELVLVGAERPDPPTPALSPRDPFRTEGRAM